MGSKKQKPKERKKTQFETAIESLPSIFISLACRIPDGYLSKSGGLCSVNRLGCLYINKDLENKVSSDVWLHAICHSLLHLGLGHFKRHDNPVLWNAACDIEAEQFLSSLKVGSPHYEREFSFNLKSDAETIYQNLLTDAKGMETLPFSTLKPGFSDMDFKADKHSYWYHGFKDISDEEAIRKHFADRFNNLLIKGLKDAVNTVSNAFDSVNYRSEYEPARRAKAWFMSNYPFLGALASGFKIVSDLEIIKCLDVGTAAVSYDLKEIYINPRADLNEDQMRFVIGHELLHAALKHAQRQLYRDGLVWNFACDFVINDWLMQMNIGEAPEGILYDKRFKGKSAEQIYDTLISEFSKKKNPKSKFATFAGFGKGDIIPTEKALKGRSRGIFTDADELDEWYRAMLEQGLVYQNDAERGYLPAALIEEIIALYHPPIPWDVRLADWLSEFFSPIEPRRTYSRMNRHQSASPDILMPAHIIRDEDRAGRVFGVILDTSCSMSRRMLASSLGAIASYSEQREVSAVRVIFCDAQPYDKGYMKPEDIAGCVEVKGRGGTILQPAVNLLKDAEDFPKDAPVLIITDGFIEHDLKLWGMEHAFLIPKNNCLPFMPKGKVFKFKE